MAPDGTMVALIVVAVTLVVVIAGMGVWVGIDQQKIARREQTIAEMRRRQRLTLPGGIQTGPGPAMPPATSTAFSGAPGPGPVVAPSGHIGPQSAVGFTSQGAASPQCFNQNLVGAPIGPADSKMQGQYRFNMQAPTSKPVPLGFEYVASGRRVGQLGGQSAINLAAYEHQGGAAGVSNLDSPEDLMVGALLAGTQEMAAVNKNESWYVSPCLAASRLDPLTTPTGTVSFLHFAPRDSNRQSLTTPHSSRRGSPWSMQWRRQRKLVGKLYARRGRQPRGRPRRRQHQPDCCLPAWLSSCVWSLLNKRGDRINIFRLTDSFSEAETPCRLRRFQTQTLTWPLGYSLHVTRTASFATRWRSGQTGLSTTLGP